jgi:ribosomal protein S18 acetylase RimI-like enzyme
VPAMPADPVRRIADGEIDAAAATLGRAFADDPLTLHAWPDPATRALLGQFLRPGVVLARELGEVWCTADLSAVACWRRPGAHEPSDEQRRAAGVDVLPQPLAGEVSARSEPAYTFLAERRDAVGVPAEHWYLTMVGVDPARRREGLGSAVIAPVLAAADERGDPVFLETMNRANPAFYERNGFRGLESGVEPSTGLPYWLFLR